MAAKNTDLPGKDPNKPYWQCKCGFWNSKPRESCIDCKRDKPHAARTRFSSGGRDEPTNTLF